LEALRSRIEKIRLDDSGWVRRDRRFVLLERETECCLGDVGRVGVRMGAFLGRAVAGAPVLHGLDGIWFRHGVHNVARVSYKFAPIWTLWVDRFMKRFDDFVITESDAGKRYLREHLNYSEKKLFTVINGVNTEVYKYDSVERSRIRKELGLDEQSIVIGSVGRLHPQKGYDVFIESMRLIKNEYPYVIGIIVGEGPELNNLKALNKSKGEPIQLLGRRMDIGSLLSAMDIYVQSSRYEGLSNAMLEAFAVGLPSVLTAVDGTIDVAKDNENALLVSPGNAIEMKNQIEKIIKNEKLKQKLGKTAQTTAIEHSNINMINHYKTLYRSFLYS
jgi:glycosyltransferase involved in cell wall biosynthesis